MALCAIVVDVVERRADVLAQRLGAGCWLHCLCALDDTSLAVWCAFGILFVSHGKSIVRMADEWGIRCCCVSARSSTGSTPSSRPPSTACKGRTRTRSVKAKVVVVALEVEKWKGRSSLKVSIKDVCRPHRLSSTSTSFNSWVILATVTH
jgi:hypothetical protein